MIEMSSNNTDDNLACHCVAGLDFTAINLFSVIVQISSWFIIFMTMVEKKLNQEQFEDGQAHSWMFKHMRTLTIDMLYSTMLFNFVCCFTPWFSLLVLCLIIVLGDCCTESKSAALAYLELNWNQWNWNVQYDHFGNKYWICHCKCYVNTTTPTVTFAQDLLFACIAVHF